MLFKPLRGCALFRSPTSQSQFTKYIFGSEVQTHKLLSFFSLSIGRALPLSLLPLHAAPCTIENIVLSFFFFCEVPPWGWMQDGYSINQASSRCELCGAKCSPRGQAQTRDIGSRWKEDRGGRRWGRVRGLFSNLVIWSQKQANLFFSFKAGGNCCENLPF